MGGTAEALGWECMQPCMHGQDCVGCAPPLDIAEQQQMASSRKQASECLTQSSPQVDEYRRGSRDGSNFAVVGCYGGEHEGLSAWCVQSFCDC